MLLSDGMDGERVWVLLISGVPNSSFVFVTISFAKPHESVTPAPPKP